MLFMNFTIPKLSKARGITLINKAHANKIDSKRIDVAATTEGGKWSRCKSI
jgi:hypothetical protein